MAIREKSPLLEASESLQEYILEYSKKEEAKHEANRKERARLESMIFNAREKRYDNAKSYTNFRNNLRHELLSEALKGIYLSALNERMFLGVNHVVLAENLIDQYIKENGGATKMLESFKGKTYLLDTIRCIVEETEEEIMDTVDPENPETQEVPEEKKENMHDALEKEQDVHAAIDIIAQRISDAEEEFIKQNAEDKKKMEELANRVNERIQAVQADPDMSEETKEDIEQESMRLFRRDKDAIHNNRPRTVFEQMMRNLSASIVKDENLIESYTDESGRLNVEEIKESVICMYGLLEMDNTLCIHKMSPEYISATLKNMR